MLSLFVPALLPAAPHACACEDCAPPSGPATDADGTAANEAPAS